MIFMVLLAGFHILLKLYAHAMQHFENRDETTVLVLMLGPFKIMQANNSCHVTRRAQKETAATYIKEVHHIIDM